MIFILKYQKQLGNISKSYGLTSFRLSYVVLPDDGRRCFKNILLDNIVAR